MTETWGALCPGDYIAGEEIPNKRVTMTIKAWEKRDFEREGKKGEANGHKKRGVIFFKETDRGWVLNKTNVQLLAGIWPDPDSAIGRKVTIEGQLVNFGAEKKWGIRVVGSPDLTAPKVVSVELPRKKPQKVTLTPTGTGAASVPAEEAFAGGDHCQQRDTDICAECQSQDPAPACTDPRGPEK